MVDLAQAARLLGRHVEGSADDRARLGARRHRAAARALPVDLLELRDPEIEHLGDLVVVVRRADEEDVLGLQIAVDDPLLVRAPRARADLAEDARRVAER